MSRVEVRTKEVGDDNGISYRYLVQLWPKDEDTPLEVQTFDEIAQAEEYGTHSFPCRASVT